jgi:hypothetical protein
MKISVRSLAVLLAVLATLTVGDRAVAQDPHDVEARDLFLAGKYDEALAAYRELHTRTRHPTYLRNIGRCHQMLRQPDPAIASFRAYLREARDVAAEERGEIEGYIAQMQQLRAAQAAAASPTPTPPAAVVATGSPPREERRPLTRQWWFWTGLGVLVVGGVATAVALSSGHETIRPPCPGDTICPP